MDYGAVMEAVEENLTMNSAGAAEDCSYLLSICRTQDFFSSLVQTGLQCEVVL